MKKLLSVFLILVLLLPLCALGEETSIVPSVLNGKSILFFGDSLLSGYKLVDFSKSWNNLLHSEYGMEVTNVSYAGSTMAYADTEGTGKGECYKPLCKRDIPEGNFDIIFVTGGGNDNSHRLPIGDDYDSRDIYTLTGAFNTLLDRLQAAHPESLIVYSTSFNRHGYNTTCVQICKRRNIPYFMACDPTISGINTMDDDFRVENFASKQDYSHLNVKGHRLYLPVIAGWLESLFAEE